MPNNKDLVLHCVKAVNEKWGYVWGTFGEVLSPSLLDYKKKQYPKSVGSKYAYICDKWLNRRTVDCVGLIKSYIWWYKKGPRYDKKEDMTADAMYRFASVSGPMTSFYRVQQPGLLLWRPGHIGVYIGDGRVVEAKNTERGVIETPLNGVDATDWAGWSKCQFIEYTHKYDFKEIQSLLVKFGYELSVDGIIGIQTKKAIINYQDQAGFKADGIIGKKLLHHMRDMSDRMDSPKRRKYDEILKDVSIGDHEEWLEAINYLDTFNSFDGRLGNLKIFKELKSLIERIGNSK